MSWPPEIDILEVQGSRTTANLMSNHFETAQGPRQNDVAWSGPDFSSGFHTFGLEWTSKQLTWYIDGVQRLQLTSHIPDKPMYMIVNLAVGGDWVGPPDPATPFPSYFQVDYVRAYRQ
jgi:beta-glucanase (GH16 family)